MKQTSLSATPISSNGAFRFQSFVWLHITCTNIQNKVCVHQKWHNSEYPTHPTVLGLGLGLGLRLGLGIRVRVRDKGLGLG